MRFHHCGYVSGDPRIREPAGVGVDRAADLPDRVDVLIVGAGPAGMVVAAQLAQFPAVDARIIDAHPGRLEVGQADGIQPRSIETFEAFGFASEIVAEGCPIIETAFWQPNPDDPSCITRASRVQEDPHGVSEYHHITVNQARVLDYFALVMARSPARMRPNFGVECVGVRVEPGDAYPVVAQLRRTVAPDDGIGQVVRAKYLVGADGAHSRVRGAIGCRLSGTSSNHAWGVLDLLAITDFPDVRRKCVIQSRAYGNILLIPREGGHLIRLYVDLGDVPPDGSRAARQTPVETTLDKARRILHPYMLDVRQIARYSVYEVGHRLCDRFDDVAPHPGVPDARHARVFIAGDAAHTHSAQAGQGMNVSIQDGFNLGWKIGQVLIGHSPERLLSTYSSERHAIGEDIIEFDKTWSTTMAKAARQFQRATDIDDAYLKITEFAQGFMTQYAASIIVGSPRFQHLAPGFPIGRRFKSAVATRVADASVRHIGHEASADGRWRLYVFADALMAGAPTSGAARLASWLSRVPDWLSSAPGATRPGRPSVAEWMDAKIVYQQRYTEVDLRAVPPIYRPPVGPFQLTDYDEVYAATEGKDIFDARGIDRNGVIVVVRPDQYVANVLPITATDELRAFLAGFLIMRSGAGMDG